MLCRIYSVSVFIIMVTHIIQGHNLASMHFIYAKITRLIREKYCVECRQNVHSIYCFTV